MKTESMDTEHAPSSQTAPDFDIDSLASPPKESLALVILWSAREPERIGEIALMFPPHKQWILGRGPDSVATAPFGAELS